MTRPEWNKIVGIIAANWPHSPPPDNSIDKWYVDLQGHDAKQVYAAVESFYREGREFPPNSGQVIARLAEADRDDVDYSEAWGIAHKLISTVSPLHEPEGYLAALTGRSPAAAEAIRRMSPRSFGSYNIEDEPTVRAQFRGFYEAVCRERQRNLANTGLPSLRRGEGPTQIGDVLQRAISS